MIVNMKVNDDYKLAVIWSIKEYVNWNEEAVSENSNLLKYKYFTGLHYDSVGEILADLFDDEHIRFRLAELERLGMISDVIIDGD